MKLTKICTYWTTLGGALIEPMFMVSHNNSPSDDRLGYQEHDVDIDVTEPSKAEVVQAAVSELRAEQKKHRAEISRLEDRISSLLCLEHKE